MNAIEPFKVGRTIPYKNRLSDYLDHHQYPRHAFCLDLIWRLVKWLYAPSMIYPIGPHKTFSRITRALWQCTSGHQLGSTSVAPTKLSSVDQDIHSVVLNFLLNRKGTFQIQYIIILKKYIYLISIFRVKFLYFKKYFKILLLLNILSSYLCFFCQYSYLY